MNLMKWSEFKKLVDAKLSKSKNPDPEIGHILLPMFSWDKPIKLKIRIGDGTLRVEEIGRGLNAHNHVGITS